MQYPGQSRRVVVAVSLFVVSVVAVSVFIHRLPNGLVQDQGAVSVLGVQAESAGVGLVVTDIQLSPMPDTSRTHVRLMTTIDNGTDAPLNISPGLFVHLVDSIGISTAATAEFTSPGEIIGGQQRPHARNDYAFDFVIDSQAQPLALKLQTDTMAKPVIMELKR